MKSFAFGFKNVLFSDAEEVMYGLPQSFQNDDEEEEGSIRSDSLHLWKDKENKAIYRTVTPVEHQTLNNGIFE